MSRLKRFHMLGQHDQKTHGNRYHGSAYGAAVAPSVAESLEQRLQSGSIIGTFTKLRGGTAGVYMGTLRDTAGQEIPIIVKPVNEAPAEAAMRLIPARSEHSRELAAQTINQAMGGYVDMPASVVRDHPEYGLINIQNFRQSAGTLTQHYVHQGHNPPSQQIMNILSHDDIHRLAVFDEIIGNLDRHWGNILVQRDGHLIAIDHGAAFPEKGHISSDNLNNGAYDLARERGLQPLTGNDHASLGRLSVQHDNVSHQLRQYGLSDAAIIGLWQRVDALSAAGEVINAERWYG